MPSLATPAGAGGRGYRVVEDRREAIGAALSEARQGDIVLVAGKGHEDYQIVGTRILRFDDRDVIRELMAGNGARP
jgi:UDP-N-acetylmuramoyl-L-alanyl-D-glutamate--2,6-diaminopimelate ligase